MATTRLGKFLRKIRVDRDERLYDMAKHLGVRYKNPEWQAECFAGELLMPYERIDGISEDEIIDQCKVSPSAAHYQRTHM